MNNNKVLYSRAEEAGENIESIGDVIDCWWSPNNIDWDDGYKHHQVCYPERSDRRQGTTG